MRGRLLLVSILLFLQQVSVGQTLINPSAFYQQALTDSSLKHEVMLKGVFWEESTAITNSFFNRIFDDGFFNDGVKEDVVEQLNDNNRFGLLLNWGVGYKGRMPNHSSLLWHASFESINFIHASFNDNISRLILFGNQPFLGEQLSLDDFLLRQMAFQTIKIGLDKAIGSKGLYISGSFNINRGTTYNQIRLTNASFFTAIDATSINLNTSEFSQQALESSDGIFNGFGLGIDFSISKELNDYSSIVFDIENLGFINWNTGVSYDTSGNFEFTGVEIDNILDPTIAIDETDGLTSILGVEKQESSFQRITPAIFSLFYKTQLSKRFHFTGGIQYMPYRDYIPKIIVQPSYVFHSTLLGSTLSYGGFSNLDVSIYFKSKVGKHLTLGFNINYLEAVIIPENSTSQGVQGYAALAF